MYVTTESCDLLKMGEFGQKATINHHIQESQQKRQKRPFSVFRDCGEDISMGRSDGHAFKRMREADYHETTNYVTEYKAIGDGKQYVKDDLGFHTKSKFNHCGKKLSV